MARTWYTTTIGSLALLGLLLSSIPPSAQGGAGHPKVINVYRKGPQPQTLDVAVGTSVVWVSHVAHTKLIVAVVAFLDGQRVAQVTSPVAGYNSFTREGGHFVGRMEGNGGKVALQFVTPGTYTYSMGHREYLPGTIVVHK